MATLGEWASNLLDAATRVRGARDASQKQLQGALEQGQQAAGFRRRAAGGQGESVRAAIAQLTDGSDDVVRQQELARQSLASQGGAAGTQPSRPPLGFAVDDARARTPAAMLEQRLIEVTSPTADGQSRFDDNLFAGYNELDRIVQDPVGAAALAELAGKYGIQNTGNEQQFRQLVVNAIVDSQSTARAETLARLNAEPNDLDAQYDDRGRVIGGTTAAGRVGEAPKRPVQRPGDPERVELPGVTTNSLPNQTVDPISPAEPLVVVNDKPYVTERVWAVNPVTGKPLLDAEGNPVPATSGSSDGSPQEQRLRSETYQPTNARRSAYRPIFGSSKSYAGKVEVVDGKTVVTPDYSRELTVLQRGNRDVDRVYLLQRQDGLFQSVDPEDANAGRLLSGEAVRDLLETQGYVQLTGPDAVAPRPGTTDASFVEVSGRRLLETFNGEGDVPNPAMLRETVAALGVLETSGGGERFTRAMVIAGKGDADIADTALSLIRRQRKAQAATEVRQRLVGQRMDAPESPEKIAGYLQQHPAFAGEPPDEVAAYASMPAEELLAAGQLSSAQGALVERFLGAFTEGYDLYSRAKASVSDELPATTSSAPAGMDAAGPGSGSQSVVPGGMPTQMDAFGTRRRFVEQSSTRRDAGVPAGPSFQIDATGPMAAETFDQAVPNEPMAMLGMALQPAPPTPPLGLLDRIRMGGSRPQMANAFAFETAPGSWASQAARGSAPVPAPFSIDVSRGSAGDVADESRKVALALGIRNRLARSGVAPEDLTREAYSAMQAREEFAGMSEDDLLDLAGAPARDLQVRLDEMQNTFDAVSGQQAETVAGPSGTQDTVGGPADARSESVAATPLPSRGGSLEEIRESAARAQSVLREAVRAVEAADKEKQLADDYAYSVDMFRRYMDDAESSSPKVSAYTGKPITMAPAARLMTFRPFTRLPKEMQAQILQSSRGELEMIAGPAFERFKELDARSSQMGVKLREAQAGIEQAKGDAAFASEALAKQRESSVIEGVDGVRVETGPSIPNPRATAEAEESERVANQKFAQSSGNATALGVRPTMSADARNAIVKQILVANRALDPKANDGVTRLGGERALPIAFRDFGTHEGGISGSSVDKVLDLQANLDAATDPGERARITSELKSAVNKMFGPGMREQRVKGTDGVRVVEPSGVNQNRLLRRFLTAESPDDRVAALREMFSERVRGTDLSDGLENLRMLAADGRLGSEEDIIYDTLIRRMEFAEAQRGAISEDGGNLEDDALSGFPPQALRQAAADAVRDMREVRFEDPTVYPKGYFDPPPAPAPEPPLSPVRRAMKFLSDVTGIGKDPVAPKPDADAPDIDFNDYLIQTLPNRDEIYGAKGSEIDRLLANIETARKNAADHSSVTGADMSRFESEAEVRVSNISRRMQQPDAGYTPPQVDAGPAGFKESDVLGDPENELTSRPATDKSKPQFAPIKIGDSNSLDIPEGYAGSIQIPADQAEALRAWLTGKAFPEGSPPAEPSGPPQVEVMHGADQDGRPSSSIKITQAFAIRQPDGTSKIVSASKTTTGARVQEESFAGGNGSAAVRRLGTPEPGMAALDFAGDGTPLQVRRSSVVTRDLRGLPDSARDQNFDGVPIIGSKPAAAADEFYPNAGKGQVDEELQASSDGSSYDGGSFKYDDDADTAAKQDPAAPAGKSGKPEKTDEDPETLAKRARDAAEGKKKTAKARRTSAAIGGVLALGAYEIAGLGGDAASGGDFGFSAPPQEDTKQSSESVGDQVRSAKRRRYSLMTPANPVPW